MEFLKNKQTYKPLERVVIFAHDQSEKYYADIYNVGTIENNRITIYDGNGEPLIVLPRDEATPFNSPDGMIYAYNMSLEYLNELYHLGEVERNIIVQQAFQYPGRTSEMMAQKSNMMNYVVMGILGLLALIGMFT